MKNYLWLVLILAVFAGVACANSSDSNDYVPPGGDGDTDSDSDSDTDSDSDSDSDSDGDSGPAIDPGSDLTKIAMIDSLEDGDGSIQHLGGRWGAWYVFGDDSADGTMTPSDDFYGTKPGYDSAFAATFKGSGYTEWGAGMGFDLKNSGDSTCPGAPSAGRNTYDVSKFDGVTFWAKGGHSMRFVVATTDTLPADDGGTCTAGDECDNHYGRTISLNSEWTQYAIKFENMTQDDGWGASFPFTPANVIGLMFMVEAGVDFDFSVDDIAFFGAEDDPENTGSGTTEGVDDFSIASGFRASPYGLEEVGLTFNDYNYLGGVGTTMSDYFSDARPSSLWILGAIDTLENAGACMLNFPNDTSIYAEGAIFNECDGNEAALSHFDDLGYKLWLQLEPGMADVDALIDIILKRYGHHECVVGFAIDVEWYSTDSEDGGTEVADEDAGRWLSKIKSYNSNYSLVLKHWISSYMPSAMDGIIYVSDSQNVGSYNDLENNFQDWTNDMSGADVGFQVGYEDDKSWWGGMSDPPETIGTNLKSTFGNQMKAYFWVDFTITTPFPK